MAGAELHSTRSGRTLYPLLLYILQIYLIVAAFETVGERHHVARQHGGRLGAFRGNVGYAVRRHLSLVLALAWVTFNTGWLPFTPTLQLRSYYRLPTTLHTLLPTTR